MGNAKKLVAHSYMSSKADVTAASELLKHGSASFESYVIKAASAAFAKVFPDDANVARVVDGEESGVKFIQKANEMLLEDLTNAELTAGVNNFSDGLPQCGLTVTQV
jgi:hypothetical protein